MKLKQSHWNGFHSTHKTPELYTQMDTHSRTQLEDSTSSGLERTLRASVLDFLASKNNRMEFPPMVVCHYVRAHLHPVDASIHILQLFPNSYSCFSSSFLILVELQTFPEAGLPHSYPPEISRSHAPATRHFTQLYEHSWGWLSYLCKSCSRH